MTVPDNDVRELRPAIVQDAESGRVLMLAWMDDEAERRTRERSRLISRGYIREAPATAAPVES